MSDIPNTQPQAQMQPVPPAALMNVVLEAQEWNVVFAGLHELPMKLAYPVFTKVLQQLQFNAQPPVKMPADIKSNGEDVIPGLLRE